MGHVQSLQNSWGKHGFLMPCLKADVLLSTVKLNVLSPTITPDKSPFLCVLAFSHIHLCVFIYIYIHTNVFAYVCEFVYVCVCVFILGFLKEGEYQLGLLSGGSDKVLQTKFALH